MQILKPILITNFKCYQESTGESALELAKIHAQVAAEFEIQVFIALHLSDLSRIPVLPGLGILAQHVDGVGFGAYTGQVPPDLVKSLGATGSLLNHSERRLADEDLKSSLKKLQEAELLSVVCAETVQEAADFVKWGADFLAVEPPELIGGDISVSTSRPELISEAVALIGEGKVLVGAGIKNEEDVRIARQLGAQGILVASGVAKAKDPLEALRSLARGLILE